MVSIMDIGNNKPKNKANWNKNKPKLGTQDLRFTGAATSENTLHNKVITSGTNQRGQIIALVEAIPSFVGINHYADWAESFHHMGRKIQADFIPIASGKQNYGAVDTAGVFQLRPDALDTEEDYNRDYKTWDITLTAGIKQWNNYVNNSKYIFLAIQGQVEPSLWNKTKDDARFTAI